MPPKRLIKIAEPTVVTIGPGQTQDIPSGATVNGVIVNGGTQIIENGGKAISTIVAANGKQNVLAGGVTEGSKLATGGTETVYGTANKTVIQKDGHLIISSGGYALGSTINSGGLAEVLTGNSNKFGDYASVVNNGGQLIVGTKSGGVVAHASTAQINDGGSLTVYDDGIISNTYINKGGALHAYDGSFLKEFLQINGGTVTIDLNVGQAPIHISSGNLILNGFPPLNTKGFIYNNSIAPSGIGQGDLNANRTVTFTDDFNGILGTSHTAYTISNIADGIKIDLPGLKFYPGQTIAKLAADKLTVTNKSSTFEIPLDGKFSAAIATSDDGHGGTLVDVMKSVAIVGAAPASLDVGHHFV